MIKLPESNFSIAKISTFLQCAADVKGIIINLRRNSERQIELNTLSKGQAILYELMKTLHCYLNDTAVLYAGERITIWSFPDIFQYKSNPGNPSFEDLEKFNETLESCQVICNHLEKIIRPSNIFLKAYYYLFDKTLGHSDYVNSFNSNISHE